ncbi:MAG: hypothetical protein RSD13_02880 [Clostridium sp.]
MEENVMRKMEEFNKCYEEVMSKDNTDEFLEKTLEVMARVSYIVGERSIKLGLKVIFANGDTGESEIGFDKKIVEAGESEQTLEEFVADYKLCVISIISSLDIDIEYYPEYICKSGMEETGELGLDIIYLHNLEADVLKELLNSNAKTI